MKHFYYVYNRGCEKPLHRHQLYEEAVAEALRLAEQEKKSYYIIESVGKVVYDHDTGSITLEGQQIEMKDTNI